MKIIALYKTWDGGEFIDASLASIYEHVSAVVMVHSDTSWLGERGNTVKPRAMEWCEHHDKFNKIYHVNVDTSSQEEQYSIGVDYIHKHFDYDVVMVVDADEVWEGQYIENAVRQMHDEPFPVYRANMHTYLKSPLYRVEPPYGSPTAFFRDPKPLTTSPRGHKAPSRMLSDVWMHHYTYVRESRELVERKIEQSCLADKSGETVVNNWMERVYDAIPLGSNLHAFVKHTKKWEKVRKIWMDEVPPAMRTSKLLSLWKPDGELMDGEQNCIYRLAKGRRVAVDLGTYKGLSASILSLACDKVYTYDCYEDLPDNTFADVLMPERYEEGRGHSFEDVLKLSSRHSNLTPYKSLTHQAGLEWNRGRIVEVLFIDGDHSYEGTMKNYEAWEPHITKGAVVLLHDNNELHPGVMKAVKELNNRDCLESKECGEYSGSLAAFTRK
jgi:hypothetical protein